MTTSKKSTRGSAKSRPRGGKTIVISDEFTGIKDEGGNVLIDDTAYFRIQRAEHAARERFEERTKKERSELAEIIGRAANDRRSADKRMAFRLDLQAAIRAFERAIVEHICELEREHGRGK